MLVLIGVGAVLLLLLNLEDSFAVMLLPRRVQRRVGLTRLFFRTSWLAWSRAALTLPAGRKRERVLSVYGPLSMVALFVLWSVGLIVGFGILQWVLQAGAATQPPPTLGEQLYMSGVTFFTLGYGDVVPHTGGSRLVAIIEAGTGFGLIAVVIGYLPVLYQLFSRREAHVIQLDARAGSPPTAATLLVRHHVGGTLERVNDLLREWELWAAELLESHLSYPMLVYYRSQHDNQSWLAALAVMMDVSALILVGVEGLAPLQARMTFTMAREVVVEIGRSFNIKPSRYTGGDRLPHKAFVEVERAFARASLPWKGGPEAEEVLAALRATYEPMMDGLSSHLLLPLQGWTAQERLVDHWASGPRGLMAQRLVEELATPTLPSGPVAAAGRPARLWRRVRARLRR
ncbi:MAG: two pore domain potassium channel family protein [Acetobacteraceae bacterium]|nr:two pore domain potassium channel family protein [Acetobacteraceae bacterium]